VVWEALRRRRNTLVTFFGIFLGASFGIDTRTYASARRSKAKRNGSGEPPPTRLLDSGPRRDGHSQPLAQARLSVSTTDVHQMYDLHACIPNGIQTYHTITWVQPAVLESQGLEWFGAQPTVRRLGRNLHLQESMELSECTSTNSNTFSALSTHDVSNSDTSQTAMVRHNPLRWTCYICCFVRTLPGIVLVP
jgi:hypothetical protein